MIVQYAGYEPAARVAVFGHGFHGQLLHTDTVISVTNNGSVCGVAIVRGGLNIFTYGSEVARREINDHTKKEAVPK
jgi:uncharacterized protein YuzE